MDEYEVYVAGGYWHDAASDYYAERDQFDEEHPADDGGYWPDLED